MRKSLLVWGGLILLFLLLVGEMGKFGTSSSAREVSYSQFLDRVDNGEVQSAAIDLRASVSPTAAARALPPTTRRRLTPALSSATCAPTR